ncbi:MAG: hypothetical protein K2N67_05205 [Mucispirillum sp.]|nr:hypothetical protein [Mucispirillum sp.]
MTCHPKLKGDKNHRSLETCINCHAPSNAKISVFGSDNDGCGDKCFQCHNRWPLDGYHAALNTCLKCHEK